MFWSGHWSVTAPWNFAPRLTLSGHWSVTAPRNFAPRLTLFEFILICLPMYLLMPAVDDKVPLTVQY